MLFLNTTDRDEKGLMAMLCISTACLLRALLISASALIFQATTSNAKNRKKQAKKTEKKTNKSIWSWSWRKNRAPWEELFANQSLENWKREGFVVPLIAKKNLQKFEMLNYIQTAPKKIFFTWLFGDHGWIQATWWPDGFLSLSRVKLYLVGQRWCRFQSCRRIYVTSARNVDHWKVLI